MNVSIMGNAGFIGSGLCEYLMDYRLIVDGIYKEDIRNRSIFKKKLINKDVIIHSSGSLIAGIRTERRKKKTY